MEELKIGLEIIGGITIVVIVFIFVRMTIALWKYNPNDFYENH